LRRLPQAAKIRPLLEALTGNFYNGSDWSHEVVARMPLLLNIVGAIIAVLGLGAVTYGIPVKEFSFGNTLIISGAIGVIGGVVILAIGAMIRQLRHIAELLAAHPLPGQPVESFETAAAPGAPPARVPFPSRPKPETATREPPPAAAEERPVATAAPTLRNPEAAAPTVEQFEVKQYEEVLLSPQQAAPAEPPPESFAAPAPPERPAEPPPFAAEEPWRPTPPRTERPSQPSYFDSMWPSESRTGKRPPVEEPAPEPPAAPAPPSEPVAILKSGVVDGMAYTLYVDGSIEAELPNGTLRFASIHELRDHLAKSS
jgi:hypothetical protein